MKIEKITFTTNTQLQNGKYQNKKENIHNSSNNYNPIAYKDFNINFGARLFRTPENFYAQSFNQNGMPQTMKDYLYDDFEDRRKMPPAQMLRLVFDDINETKSLEQVKRLYKDEPLFKNLTDTPNRKVRTGVLAEIDLMKQDGKTLFKNGQDNLGLYILRKIYAESKTLKEINKDFQKDISVHYKGLSDIDYSTLSAYGIKFPNNSFWKSLTATREEFPYEYKPRKPIAERHSAGGRAVATGKQIEKPKQKGKFEDVKDWEIDKLTDAMVKGNGSKTQTEKLLKKHASYNKESLNFVAKYMGEINSLVLEKLHISDDMKDYFENYDDLTKNQKEKFESYMKIPQINEHRSKVMSATIRFFFDVYGVDGNNEEFQELLEYTHNIKAKRIENQRKHNLLQEEYERELGIFEENNSVVPATVATSELVKPKNVQEYIDEVKNDYNVESFEFDTPQGKVVILSNTKEILNDYWRDKTVFMPTSFSNKFLNFINQNQSENVPYILSAVLRSKGVDLPQDDRLIDESAISEIETDMYQKFSDENRIDVIAAQQAVVDAMIELSDGHISPRLFAFGIFELDEFYKNLSDESRKLILTQKSLIDNNYKMYKQKLTDAEARKVTLAIMEQLRNYHEKDSIVASKDMLAGTQKIIPMIKLILTNKDSCVREPLKKQLAKYFKDYHGGTGRVLLSDDWSQQLKNAKMQQMLTHFIYDNSSIILCSIYADHNAFEYARLNDPELYAYLKHEFANKAIQNNLY